jgi:hypothetical protein
MATCPRCLGPLTDHHQCTHGLIRRLAGSVVVVMIGAAVGALFTLALTDRPVAALVLAASALGAVLAKAIVEAVGRKS